MNGYTRSELADGGTGEVLTRRQAIKEAAEHGCYPEDVADAFGDRDVIDAAEFFRWLGY